MAQQNRTDLKAAFGDGKVPTGTDFADFIDSGLNQADDKITINESGFMGINTNNPSEKLEVCEGNINIVGDSGKIYFDDRTKYIGDHLTDGLKIGTTDNNSIVMDTNGSNSMVITGDGNVGIGTTGTPAALLDVNGDLQVADTLTVNGTTCLNDDVTIASGKSFKVEDALTIDNDGSVGIGTNSPNALLDVNGNVRFLPSTITPYNCFEILKDDSGTVQPLRRGITIGDDTVNGIQGYFNFFINSSQLKSCFRFIDGKDSLANELMTINSSGNVTIGNEDTGALDVNGDTHLTETLTVDGTTQFNNNVSIASNKTLTVGGDALFNDNVIVANNRTLTVEGSSVFYNTPIVYTNLYLFNSITPNTKGFSEFRLNGYQTDSDQHFGEITFYNYDGISNYTHMSSIRADVDEEASTSRLSFSTTSDDGSRSIGMTLDKDGNLKIKGDYGQISSKRYKENILDFTDDFLKILQIQPKSFVYKNSGVQSVGYVAEELHELGLTSLIKYNANQQPEAIKYQKIQIYLLEVLKALKKEVTALKSEIKSLKES